MFDFSAIPEIEAILNYSVGGLTVGAIILIAIKIINWLKSNNLATAFKTFTDSIIGKDIGVDLTNITKQQFTNLKTEIIKVIREEVIPEIKAGNVVAVDSALMLTSSKLITETQVEKTKRDCEIIEKGVGNPVRETISVKLEPVVMPKATTQKTEQEMYID